MSKYSEKLKHPKWQKMRLNILDRDNWMCQICKCVEKNLQVHHKFYDRDKNPWDYPYDAFITLCEDCHSYETHERQAYENLLILNLKKHFSTDEVKELAYAFGKFKIINIHEIHSKILHFIITNEFYLREAYNLSFDDLIQKLKDENSHGCEIPGD